MFVVSFSENKNVLLSQLLKRVPSVGEDLTIKGRKCKVSSVNSVDERHFTVQVLFEKVNKPKPIAVDNSKKKKSK